jgi:hypothetical protein
VSFEGELETVKSFALSASGGFAHPNSIRIQVAGTVCIPPADPARMREAGDYMFQRGRRRDTGQRRIQTEMAMLSRLDFALIKPSGLVGFHTRTHCHASFAVMNISAEAGGMSMIITWAMPQKIT